MYFAAKESEEVAAALVKKAALWYNGLYSNGFLNKVQDVWAAYYNMQVNGDGHAISFSGEQGELVNLSVNHLRNIGRHMHTMVVTNRPAFQARASNTDYKSLAQTKLANELLDYYMREKRLEQHLQTAVELAIVTTAGYIKMDWNATSGEIYDYDENNNPLYDGDVQFET